MLEHDHHILYTGWAACKLCRTLCRQHLVNVIVFGIQDKSWSTSMSSLTSGGLHDGLTELNEPGRSSDGIRYTGSLLDFHQADRIPTNSLSSTNSSCCLIIIYSIRDSTWNPLWSPTHRNPAPSCDHHIQYMGFAACKSNPDPDFKEFNEIHGTPKNLLTFPTGLRQTICCS